MSSPLFAVAAIMLFSGALGGAVNFYMGESKDAPSLTIPQHMLIGIAAAMIVPLFLTMIASELLNDVLVSEGSAPPAKLLVLTGFCLVAAISSRTFIASMTKRVLQEAQQAKNEAKQAKEEASAAKASVETILDAASEPDEPDAQGLESLSAARATASDLAPEELSALRAFKESSFAMRSLSGIRRATNLDDRHATDALKALQRRGFVDTRSTSTGSTRWILTAAGRVAADSDLPPSDEQEREAA